MAQASDRGLELLALDRGADVFAVGRDRPRLLFTPTAVTAEDPGRWILRWLWERGIAPDQVVSVGVAPGGVPAGVVGLGGGLEALAVLLEDQIARRDCGELPIVVGGPGPGWTLTIDDDAPLERVHESLLTLADGRLGTRGSAIVERAGSDPGVLMSGVYTRTGAETHLLAAPRWNRIASNDASRRVHRVLDLHTGVLHQQLSSERERVDALLFSSLARPAIAVMRATQRDGIPIGRPLEPPPGVTHEAGEAQAVPWMRVRGRPGSVAVAVRDDLRSGRSARVLDRVAAPTVASSDVVMLHYLVPDEVASGSLEPNLEFYEPRTAHGSTLSTGVHAALFARAGRLAEAVEMLRLTARIDLDDIGHMTAGGLHLAAMGSVWRALAFGFAGLRPMGAALAIDPVLPSGWETLELRSRFRGSRVRIRIRPGAVEASGDPSVSALTSLGEQIELTPSAARRQAGDREDGFHSGLAASTASISRT